MNPRDQLAAALVHHREGRMAEAEAGYREILATHPAHVDAWQLLGALASQTGRNALAIQLIERALALSPDNAVILSNLGYALIARNRSDEAVSHLEKAIALKPDYVDAHVNLGVALANQTRLEEAAAAFRRAIAIRADHIKAFVNLGDVLLKQKRPEEAAAVAMEAAARIGTPSLDAGKVGALLASCGRSNEAVRLLHLYLEYDPPDRLGARLLLGKLGAGPAPERTSQTQIEAIYAKRAEGWDGAPYHGHRLVAAALERLSHSAKDFDILDAGCGTGLVGALVAPFARRLEGIDLSPAMLAKAKEKRIYTTLHEGDLVTFMAIQPEWFDAIVSAATLIHFSDLAPVFAAAATTLRDNGLFIFTVFPDDVDENTGVSISLARSGCFTHSSQAIRDAATAAGFTVELMETDVHELLDGVPLNGLVVGLRRQTRSQTQKTGEAA